MICNCILEHVTPLPLSKEDGNRFSRKLVIDYSGCPIQFTCQAGDSLEFDKKPVFLTDLPPLGEADIKYLRWANVFQGNIIAYSVDGDFIPIALIHQEKLAASRQKPSYRIALYRIKYKIPVSSASAKQKKVDRNQLQLAGSKRKGNGDLVLSTSSAASPAAAAASEKPTRSREYEYVDVSALYEGLRKVFGNCGASINSSSSSSSTEHYMRMLAVLVGLGGTDFSRNLPHVGPVTLWNMVVSEKDVFSALTQAYDQESSSMVVDKACNLLVTR